MINQIKKIKKHNLVLVFITLTVYLANIMCVSLEHLPGEENRLGQEKKFAGSASCASCHNEIYKNHIQTAHYMDSKPASKEFIKGSFARDKNKFVYNKWTKVVLEQKKDKFFQVALINDIELQRQSLDIVIGSGRKGQTYLWWDGNKLFQLPVSYYTPMNSWCNSPGFPTTYVRFNRPISAQCLECHSTYAKEDNSAGDINTFNKAEMIYGIDCERCHGPAAEHVAFHQKKPDEKKARYIINTKNMDRQLRLDACAVCHSGFRNAIQPAFSFMPGDKLDDFSSVMYNTDSVATLDVHGNQYGLLTSSKCFKMNIQLDCSSCHNMHINEFNNTQLFSQRCINCHSETTHTACTVKPQNGLILGENCIDCHMPVLPSGKIQLDVANMDSLIPDPVRTHRIAIYPDKTNEFIRKLKAGRK